MVKNYLKLLRIPHWIKNFFVFVPILFSKHFFDVDYLENVIILFFAFSSASSLIYVFNDISDIKLDKQHPIKKYRPLASGAISVNQAYWVIVVLGFLTALLISLLNFIGGLLILGYVLLNMLYSVKLKNIVIVDLFCIAAGFMLRVLAGGLAINIEISNWLILTTLFLSLFLAIMKRRSELETNNGDNITRTVLKDYSKEFIDQIGAITAGGLIICYALYSVSDRTIAMFHTEAFVFTTIFVVFGVFRYMFLVYKQSKGENPTEIMLTDFPMIINGLIYIFVVILIIYSNRI